MKTTNLIKYLITLLAITIMFSCEREEITDLPSKKSIVKLNTVEHTNSKLVLGKGYDATGKFCNASFIKMEVLDQNKLYNDSKIIKNEDLDETNAEMVEGETIREYQKHFNFAIATDYEHLDFFSGEAKANFEISSSACDENSYVSLMSFTQKHAFEIEGRQDPEILLNYVKSEFTEKVNKLNCNNTNEIDRFVNAYGTHVITSGVWGASLKYNMTAMHRSASSSISLEAYANAKIKSVKNNASLSSEISNRFKESFETSTLKTIINVKGGKSQLGALLVNSFTNKNLEKWVNSIDDNLVLCGYLDQSLIPIWEFVKDSDKKEKLKKGIIDYFNRNKVPSKSNIRRERLEKDFSFAGTKYFENKHSDSDIASHDGKNTGVEIDMSLSISTDRRKVIVTIEKVLFIEGGLNQDKTINGFKRSEKVELYAPHGFIIRDIKEKDWRWEYRNNLEGKNSSIRRLKENYCPWYWNSGVQYDGSGISRNDCKHSKIKGTFKIDVEMIKL